VFQDAGLRSMASSSVNIEVVAPTPSARVSTATVEYAGCRHNIRNP